MTSIDSIVIDGFQHTWAGDLQVTLGDPNGIEHLIFLRPGYLNTSGAGTSGDFTGGSYTFVESAGASLPTSSNGSDIPPGTYNQTFDSGGVVWNSGNVGINNTPLGQISGPAGNWTLTIYDWAAGDTGSFTSWTLNGMGGPGGGAAGSYAIRGMGQGVAYAWTVQDMSNITVATGNLTTANGASGSQMRDQLVQAIHNSATGLTASSGGWTPGPGWSPFQVDYVTSGTTIPIQLIVDGCVVDNSTLSNPCHFNPDIAGAGQDNLGSAYCFGDGTGPTCPCSAFGSNGEGCLNSSGIGATLLASGNASFSNDTLQLSVSGAPASKPGLLLRGDNQLAIPVGDGILCAGGGSQRSQVQITSGGATVYSDFNGSPLGSVANAGAPTNYQFWYRDPQNPCGGGFNFTNGWTVTYLP